MFSVLQLNNLRDNLKKDLERVYNLCKAYYDSLFDLEKVTDELNTLEEDFSDPDDKPYLEAMTRFREVILRYSDLRHIYPKLEAASTVLLYDFIVHPILFTNWDWRKEKEEWNIDFRLSASEIYDGLVHCNPDAVKICISKLDNCSIADIEYLQKAFEKGQKEDFVNKLRSFNSIDIAVLHFVASIFHIRNSFLTIDIKSLFALLFHFDFGAGGDLIATFLGEELPDINRLITELENEDITEEEEIILFNNLTEVLEKLYNKGGRSFLGVFKYYYPDALDAIRPFDFERKYLQDVLDDPLFASCVEKYPISRDELFGSHKREEPDISEPAVPLSEVKSADNPKAQKEQGGVHKQRDDVNEKTETKDKGNKPFCQCSFAPNVSTASVENLRKRSFDDFAFVKEAGYDALYESIQEAILTYDEDKLRIFCRDCRGPLEVALSLIFSAMNYAPDDVNTAGAEIGRLKQVLPVELFTEEAWQLLTDYNTLTRRYNHKNEWPEPNEWGHDAEKCYFYMWRMCQWMLPFMASYEHFIKENGTQNYDLIFKNRKNAPQGQPGEMSPIILPNIKTIVSSRLENDALYKEFLEKELDFLYSTFLSHVKQNVDRELSLYGVEDIRESLSEHELETLNKELSVFSVFPLLAAAHLVWIYISVIHPILFSPDWSPDNLKSLANYGENLSSKQIYDGLLGINKFAVKKLIGKLDCPLRTIEDLQAKYLKREDKEFISLLRSQNCDLTILQGAAKIMPMLLMITYGVTENPPEAAGWLKRMYMTLVPDQMSDFMERPIVGNDKNGYKDPEDSESPKLRMVRAGIKRMNYATDMLIRFLASLPHSHEWLDYFDFERNYVINALAIPEVQESLKSIGIAASSTNDSLYTLPLDLFEGKVDTVHTFIPGLKTALKDREVFERLFNYILRLGGISSVEEAGALLRVFTGYPVDNASDKAKWETDYHILLYLVKYMFTPKKSYAKMSECIDIYYPSDDERQKAEKTPSSYAERISGDDAPSIIETLHRLSDVFPRPSDPLTD